MFVIIIVIIIAALAFCLWLCHDSGSSSSKATAAPKATATTAQPKTAVKDPKISELEAEISRLKHEKFQLELSVITKDALIEQKDIEISNYQNSDAQKKISELEASLKTAQRFRDSHWSQLTSLKKEHEKYVKDTEEELKKAKDAAALVSKENYENEIARLRAALSQTSPTQAQFAELNAKIKTLEQINETHKNTIASLKKELAESRKATHASNPPAEEERRHYEEKIDKLKEELKEPTYFKNLFTSSLKKLKNEGDTLFYNYPSVHDFLRQVTDKRFHRAMIEDISISEKIQVQASIRSGGSTYVTTLQNCTCVDYNRTHAPCKHMLFLAYHTGVLLIHKEDAEKSMKKYLDQLRTTPVPKK